MLSTVWVGSEQGTETSAVRLSVPAGGELFRVVVLPQPTPVLWSFEGAVSRIREVRVLGADEAQVRGQGVLGLHQETVRFVRSPGCRELTAEGLATRLGRQGPVTPVAADVHALLPEGTAGPSLDDERAFTAAAGGPLTQEALSAFPNGVMDLPPGKVVSVGGVGRYAILPRMAGVATLMAQNLLRPDPLHPRSFLLHSSHFVPANLCGNDAVRFVVDGSRSHGLQGDLCDSCVVRAGSHEVLRGNPSTCPGLPDAARASSRPVPPHADMRPLPPVAACSILPRPLPGQSFVVVHQEAGAALSMVSVAPPDSRYAGVEEGVAHASHASILEIEPGDAPLYVIFSSKISTLVHVRGAVHRVAALLLDGVPISPNTYPAEQAAVTGAATHGVVGLPADKVHFVDDFRCVAASLTSNSRGGAVPPSRIEELAQRFGRRPDAVVGAKHIERVSLPSGDMAAPLTLLHVGERDLDRALAEHIRWEAPSGTLDADQASVVARYPLVRHATAPGLYGLLQLQREGAVELRWMTTTSPGGGGGKQRLEVRVRKEVDLPYPSWGATGFMWGGRIVYEPGIRPSAVRWAGTCTLAEGGLRIVSGERRCRSENLAPDAR